MNETLTLFDISWHFVFGGLGLFLYGMKLMGDNLTNFAGSKIRDYIDKYTNTPLKAVLVGLGLTALLQSSSASTVIAISLVSAGLMKLDQAIGITLGSNIGSTITAILIGFNLEAIAYFFVLIGVIIAMIAHQKSQQYLANIIIGFGLLFIGLSLMGGALKQLQYVMGFSDLMIKIAQTPIIGVFFGAAITGIIQSSAAVIGIVQKLFQADAINLTAALTLVISSNIGTTVTGILASLGSSISGKRASAFHFIFNVIVASVTLLFLKQFTSLVEHITIILNLNPLMSIAVAHFIFNLLGVIVFFPFLKQVVAGISLLIKGSEKSLSETSIVNFDEQMITTFPAGALTQAKKGVLNIAELTTNILNLSEQYLLTKDKKIFKEINQIEQIINTQDTKINTYLIQIAKQHLPEDLFQEYATALQVEKNLERIADLAQNLAEYYEIIFDGKEDVNPTAKGELKEIYQILYRNLAKALDIYTHNNKLAFGTLKADEIYLNQLESKFRRAHFRRITHDDEKANYANSMFIDILSTMERIGDHAFNIAINTVSPVKTHVEKVKENSA